MTIEPEEPSLRGNQRDPRDTTTTHPDQQPSVMRRYGGREVETRVVDLSFQHERASPDVVPGERNYVEGDEPGTSQQVRLLEAQTANLYAQANLRDARTRSRDVTGHNVVRIVAVVIGAAALVAWLTVVLTGGDEAAITAVSAVALIATNFATNVLTKSRGDGKDDDAGE